MSRRKDDDAPPTTQTDPWHDPETKAAIASARQDVFDLDGDERFDDYVNPLTGIGDWMQDKSFGGRQGGLDFVVRYLSVYDCEARWRGSDLGGRIIETVPDEMTREGFDVVIQPAEDKAEEDAPADDETQGAPLTKDAFPQQQKGGAQQPQPGAPGQPPPKPEVGPLPELDDEGAEISEELHGICDDLGVLDKFWEALCYERAFGGSAILIGAEDGMSKLTKPLDEENIKSVNWLNTFQGGREGEIIAWSYYNDPKSPKFGLPEIYMVRNITNLVNQPAPDEVVKAKELPDTVFWVHESRLLVFAGTSPSRRARLQGRGWGDSLFTRIDEVLSQYSQTWGGISNLMSSYHQDVLKMSGMAVKMAGGDKAAKGNALTKRARLIQQTRSIARMMVIDEGEEFQRLTASLAGAAELVQQYALRLAAAADMPVTLLMGQAPAGLNATGNSDIRFFYDRIAARQRRKLLPQLKRLLKLIFLSKEGPTKGKEPERWDVKFRSLYQMTDLEKADLRLKVQQADVAYIGAGVVSAEEIAASRFGGSEYSMDTTIDIEGRQKMADQHEADTAEMKGKQEAIMGEAASAGLDPSQLALSHPEHPSNAEDPEDPSTWTPPKKDEAASRVDDLETAANALKTMREAGAVVDMDKLREQFPDLPVKRIVEDD